MFCFIVYASYNKQYVYVCRLLVTMEHNQLYPVIQMLWFAAPSVNDTHTGTTHVLVTHFAIFFEKHTKNVSQLQQSLWKGRVALHLYGQHGRIWASIESAASNK